MNDKPAAAPPAARRRRVLFALTAIVLGLLAAVLFLEALVRVVLYRHAESIDRLYEDLGRDPGQELSLREIIRPSDNPARVYELAPGLNSRFVGVPLRTNSEGFRDREWIPAKAPGTYRIAVLGDSIAFGWGVEEKERFSNRLEDLLNRQRETSPSLPRFEVLNFAVPGYNTVMELATFREKVLKYDPDLLILSVVPNDAEVPNFFRRRPDILAPDRLFVYEALRNRLRGLVLGYTAREVGGGLVTTPDFRKEEVPAELRFLVGFENAEQALTQLGKEAGRLGIPAIAVFHHPLVAPLLSLSPEQAQEARTENTRWQLAARQAGFRVSDSLAEVLRYLRENRAGQEALWVRPGEDLHPNAAAHRITAAELVPDILKVLQKSPKGGPK